jgi:hypothetical protein
MTPAAVVTGQVAALLQSVSQVNGLLDRFGQMQAPASNLLQRVKGRFRNDLLGLKKRCTDLYKIVQDGKASETDLGALAKLEREALDLFRECLAFLEGASIRASGIDGGICQIADSMLYNLSRANDLGWERFTLVAVGEFFSTRSGIVRLRFTDTRIWNLPVATHEFGHYVSGLPAFSDFQTTAANAARKDSRFGSHLGELFSDLFATYAMGPSYFLNCALLRFGLSNAADESTTHPSSSQRVWWMAATLAKMDEGSVRPIYADVISEVKDLWEHGLALANQPQLPEGEISRLRQWLVDLYDLVDSRLPNAKYGRWYRAQDMLQSFQNGDGEPDLRDDDSIPDILNAVWLYRLQMRDINSFELDQIEKSAFDLCTKLANTHV